MAQFEVNFYSYTLEHGVDISVTIPSISPCDEKGASHKPAHKFPVLYLLHGRGNDRHCWNRYTSVQRLAEEQRIALVTFDCQNKYYNNLPAGDRYYDFLNEELHDFVCGMFPISSRPEDTYIAGLSMGGYGTLVHAYTNPKRYCAYGAMSPGVSVRKWSDSYGHDPIEPIEEAQARAAEGVKLPAGYICCGKQDFLYEPVCEFVEKMKALGEDFVWRPIDGFEHEWRFWDLEIARFLSWIPRTDPYAGHPHKI